MTRNLFRENVCLKQIVVDFFICGIITIQEIKEVENDVFVGSLYSYLFSFLYVNHGQKSHDTFTRKEGKMGGG
jgi:hypothetical protein